MENRRFAAVGSDMEVKIEESWKKILAEAFEKPYFAELAGFVKAAYRNGVV